MYSLLLVGTRKSRLKNMPSSLSFLRTRSVFRPSFIPLPPPSCGAARTSGSEFYLFFCSLNLYLSRDAACLQILVGFPGKGDDGRRNRGEGRSWKVMLIFIFVYLLPHRTPICCHALVVIAEGANEFPFLFLPFLVARAHREYRDGATNQQHRDSYLLWYVLSFQFASFFLSPDCGTTHPSFLSTSCSEFVFSILTCLFCSSTLIRPVMMHCGLEHHHQVTWFCWRAMVGASGKERWGWRFAFLGQV